MAMAPARLWMVPATLTVFLTGPLALLRTGLGSQKTGYSFLNLLCMSFRPHVNLATLLLVGVTVAVIRAADGRARRPVETTVVVASCLIALGITDEPSAALTGLGLAVTWLFVPDLFGARRWTSLLILVSMGVGIVVANLVFQASLSPGGPISVVRLVPWRSPGSASSRCRCRRPWGGSRC